MVKRNIKVTFRLNAKEQQRLKKNVKKAGLSQETYIRTLLDGYAPREPPSLEYHSMMRELHAIGNRMNQIAARANTTGFFLAEEYERNVRELNAAIGKSFLKSYAAVCLEGAIIVLACVIFSAFASSPPVVSTGGSPVTMVWSYMGELIFNLLVLTGAVKMADRVVREMFGL